MNSQQAPIITNAKFIVTDSRTVFFASESIFFAIKTNKNDGHFFMKDLFLKGVREFVIEEKSASDSFFSKNDFLKKNCKYWIVENSIQALQQLAANHRKLFVIPIIGITGSNGKTIVKEWLCQILANNFIIAKSPKSFNSQLGVPLSVWQLNKLHTLGVFEAGISQPNEMAALEEIIKPTIGIFTNIGPAHDEFFENRSQKIKEKLKLFANSKQLIYCRDDVQLNESVIEFSQAINPNCEVISWSLIDSKENSFQFTHQTNTLSFDNNGHNFNFKAPFSDNASIQNICNCIVTAKLLGISNEQINFQLSQMKQVEMRLELKEGINNTQLVDDSYNNDFLGLKLAIEFLNQQKNRKNKLLILSDILQAGEHEPTLYQNINKLIETNNIAKLVGIGPVISRNAKIFPRNSVFYKNTEDFIDNLNSHSFADSIILIKGARAFAFEKIVRQLQAKNHDTFLEINLDSITHNFNYFKQKLTPTTKIMAMVKAFAYGAGNKEIARLLQHQGVDYLGVAYIDEGIYLRESGINSPIMVMNPTENDFNKMIDFRLEPEIYSIKKLNKLADYMDGKSSFAKIHVKLDTGMHRLGFQKADIQSLIEILVQNPNIIVATIFSHLVGAENENLDSFSQQQYQEFREMAGEISLKIGYKPIFHILNSAGIARFPNYSMDMVRLGIGLYGVGSNVVDKNSLAIVGTLKSKISQIKEINENDTVGYGRRGRVSQKSRIATIAIGYADGFSRKFGNGVGQVLINDILCPTIGNICMDMAMIDVTNTKAEEGDEVIIFGEKPTIFDLAKQIDTIPYEILTNIGERVKRVFYKV